jgi:Tol biopolymer transport system component
MRAIIAIGALGLAAIVAAPPIATAAVPGTNGRIAFVSTRGGSPDIWTMNPDGSGQKQLTTALGQDIEPAFSPSADRIAFRSERDGNPEIYIMDATGAGQMRLTNNSVEDVQPDFFPDASKLIFAEREAANFPDANLWTMGLDGANPLQITVETSSETESAVSPQATKIAFTTGRDTGNNELWTMNATGGGDTNLTQNSASDVQPEWSPDGTKIAFASNRDGDYDVYVMDANGANVTQLTNDAGFDQMPAWSPDGSKIAFASTRDGDSNIYVMDANGSNPAAVTNDSGDDYWPAWAPAAPAPQATTAPSISGQAVPGSQLTCDPGAWIPTSRFVFEWLRDGLPIAGQTQPAYTPTSDDVGHQLACRVTATTAADMQAQATSAPVTPAQPATTPPSPPPSPPSGKTAPTQQEQALAAAPPAKVAAAFGLPSAHRCLSRRRFTIHLKRPAGVTIASARITVHARTTKARKVAGRFQVLVDLRGLPKGRFKVLIVVKTRSGLTLRGARRYRTCTSRHLSAHNNGPL